MLDAEHLPSSIEIGVDTDMSSGITEPGHGDEVGSRGAQSDGVMTAPSVVQGCSASASTASQHSQPASQPTQRTGQDDIDSSVNVMTPGMPAGAVGGTRRVCHHSRDGVCDIHGPGARWIYKLVPLKNPVPGGKRTRKQHYWECEVNMRGKMMKQTRISFGKVMNEMSKGDNKGNDGTKNTRTMGE